MTTTADGADFAALTAPWRREVFAHCYRMIGSVQDAEDLVQETYVRAWRGFAGFEGRSSVRRWLHAIATTVCLTALGARSRRPLPSGLGAPADDHRVALAERDPSVPWLEPAPDTSWAPTSGDPAAVVAGRAGVRLAFVAALQLLPARQRAVLTLRDVLGFRAAEVAAVLDTTADAVDSALRRARRHLAEAAPVAEELGEPADAAERSLLDAYVRAFTRAEPDALVDLLRADVELEMPPIPTWFTGQRRRGRLPRRPRPAPRSVAARPHPGQRAARPRRAPAYARRGRPLRRPGPRGRRLPHRADHVVQRPRTGAAVRARARARRIAPAAGSSLPSCSRRLLPVYEPALIARFGRCQVPSP